MLGSAGLGTVALGRSRVRRGNVRLVAEPGAVVVTGQDVGLYRRYTLVASPGAVTVTGRNVDLYLIGISPPVAVISAGGWTDQDGTTAGLVDAVDEFAADDSDFIASMALDAGESDTIIFKLQDMADPQALFGHRMAFRFRKQLVSGNRSASLTVALLHGTDVVATTTASDIGTSFLSAELELSPAQIEMIEAYDNLFLRLTAAAS